MAEYRETKARKLFELFGGVTKLATELGVSKSVISRWDSEAYRGNHGHVPTHYNIKIMERAKALGLDIHAVSQCLDEHICPCCKRPLEPGMTIDKRYLRTVLAGMGA
ncbi:hypothetical protein [Microvirga sp. G4-2]|uniref:hypothetical protein n=1 Tax=Microvirga sp. G4-2 TaxID=3434467 RepID=UPI0040450D47